MTKEIVDRTLSGIMYSARNKFARESLNERGMRVVLEEAVKTNPQAVETLPDFLVRFTEQQLNQGVGISFADVLYVAKTFVKTTLEEREEFRKLFNGDVDTKNLSLIDFVNALEGKPLSSINIPSVFRRTSYKFNPVAFTDLSEERLGRQRGLLANYWNDCNDEQNAGWRYLFETEAVSGDFRVWLETQPSTAELKREFQSLGLNYSAWDDPNVAYGYKGKLEEIVANVEKAKMAAEDLTKRLTKGDFTGCLIAKPAQVFKGIGPIYKDMKTAEDVNALLAELQKYVNPKHLQQGKVAKEFERVGALATGVDLELAGRNYDFVFRTWRRQPSHDFCEGNDSGICTSFNGASGEAMINYLVDKGVSLVDVVHKGKRHGQIYLFGALDKDRNPLLVLDSLEVGNNASIDERRQDLYVATEEVVNDIARKAGFKNVFVSGTLYWRHSSAFLNHLMHKYDLRHEHDSINWFGERVEIVRPENSDMDEVVISKIGNTRPIKSVLGHIGRRFNKYVGRKHYFDIYGVLGQEDTFDWKENCDNYTARGVLLKIE